MKKQILVSDVATGSSMPSTTDRGTYHSPLLSEWGDLQSLTLGGLNRFDDGDGTGSSIQGRIINDLIPPWQNPQP